MLSKILRLFKNSKLLENFLSFSFLEFSNVIIPLVLIPFYLVNFSSSIFGLVATGLSISSLINLISELGVGVYAPIEVSQNRNDKFWLKSIVIQVFSVKLFAYFILFIFAGLSIRFFFEEYFYFLFFFTLIPIGNLFNLNWFFQGIEQLKKFTLLHSSTRIFFISFIFFLIEGDDDIYLIPVMMIIGNIFPSLLIYFTIFKKQFGDFKVKVSINDKRKTFLKSLKFLPSKFSQENILTTITIFISKIYGFELAGNFTLIEKSVKGLTILHQLIYNSVIAHISFTKNINISKYLAKFFFIFHFLIAFIFYLYKDNFDIEQELLDVFIILLLAMPFFVLGKYLGFSFLAVLKSKQLVNFLNFLSIFILFIILLVTDIFFKITLYSLGLSILLYFIFDSVLKIATILLTRK